MKLIASDMDGTLLDQFWRVSEENKQAILKAQAQGIQFIVATGRPYTNVNVIMEEAGIHCPVISLNGAETRDASGKLIASQPLSREQIRKVHPIMLEEGMYYELMTNKGSFSLSKERYIEIARYTANRELPHLSEEERERIMLSMCEERIRNENCQFVDSFDPIIEDDEITILKVFSMTLEEERIERASERLRQLSGLSITSSAHGNLEVNHENGHKGYAVMQYAKSIGIQPEEVMAIGDGYNDLTMLQLAGRGVAMANAPESLRKQVKYVTKNNIESGVAHAILDMLAHQHA